MKGRTIKRKSGSWVSWAVLCLAIAFLPACGGSSGGSGDDSANTGSVSVQLHQIDGGGTTLAPVLCYPNDSNIVYVEVRVYDETNTLVATGGPWDCNLHHGTVNDVPAGCNITVVALGQDDQSTNVWRGQATVCVEAGKTTEVTIDLTPFDVSVISPPNTDYLFTSEDSFQWYGDWERNWIQVTDDTDTNFASPVLNEPEVISTTSPREYTPPVFTYGGHYLWRVRALDAFGNATGWSEGGFTEGR